MSRSLIQVANQSAQNALVNSIINLGNAIRRFGCNCRLNGNAIEVEGDGYYIVDADITVAPTVAGNVSYVLNENGDTIPGAIARGSVSTAGNNVSLHINTTVRVCCCDCSKTLTFVLTEGAGVINNVSVRVQKV